MISSYLDALKYQARTTLERYRTLRDRYDCGKAVAEYLNPEIAEVAAKFNSTMDTIAGIDPNCPRERL
jgi:hypothetical protein